MSVNNNNSNAVFFIELQEYLLGEAAEILGVDSPKLEGVVAGLVPQGLARIRMRPNPAGAEPTSTVAFSFVGVVSCEDIVIRCFPKFFITEDCNTERFNKIVKTIFRQRSSAISPHARIDESLDSIQNAMDEAVFFVADYLQNGEYPASPIVCDDPELGEIDWMRTIDERMPWISEGSAVYLDPIRTYAANNSDDFCQRLHLAIVSDCFRFLKSVGIAEVIGIGMWPPTETKVSTMGSPSTLLNKVRSEKRIQFNDRRLQLLAQMERYLERMLSLRRSGSYGYFGTAHFEIVWETLCSVAFENQRDTSIGKCLTNAVIPPTSRGLTSNSTLKDLIEKPLWQIDDGNACFEARSQGKLNPDILLVRSDKGRELAILDAKYYAIDISNFTVSNEPGVEDIVKQHAYQMALQGFANANEMRIINALLFPSASKTKIIGYVHYGPMKDFTEGNLRPIAIAMLNFDDVIDYYLMGLNRWRAEAEDLLNQIQ